ncbi:MAG: DUF4401 domain-containing protein [Urechidicola sp.]|nr:DUF4401 domain-containing protein [Urechidicola sp.]
MHKEKNISALLEQLKNNSKNDFSFDKEAILEEYAHKKDNQSSLVIKVLSIFGGFLGTLFFTGFIFTLGVYDSEIGILILGLLLIISSIWMNKEYDKLILDTFSISMYAIGFVMLGIAFNRFDFDENIISLLFILIAATTLFITQNYIISFISVLVINGGLLTLINLNDIYNTAHIYIAFNTFLLLYWMLNEAKIITMGKKVSKLYNPVRIGLMVSLLFGFIILGNKHIVPELQDYRWISSIIQMIAVIYLVNKILDVLNVDSLNQRVYAFSLSILILASTVFSPAVTGAIMILLLSYLVNYKTGFALGIVYLAYFISQFYYDLSFTLLTKSIILFSSGIVFLLFYLITRKKLHVDEKI